MAAASKTSIANLAVAHHAGDWIEDVDSAPGRLPEAIREVWDSTLTEALATHLWKFAKTSWRNQAALPAGENPDDDMGFAYRKPSNCVRVFELRPAVSFDEWEDGKITTDVGPSVTMIGTKNNAEIGRFSAFFCVYLGALLAYRICTPVNASEAIRKRCRDEQADALAMAMSDTCR